MALAGLLLCFVPPVSGQRGRNEAVSYLELGSATPVSRIRYGMAAEARIRLHPLVSVQGGFRLANSYPSGLGDVKVGATLFFSKRSERWSCENVVNFSNYAPYPMSQLYYRLTAAWETKHFRIDMGNAFAFFIGSGITKYKLFQPTFALEGWVKEKDGPWNAAFFIRNFNRFEAHGSRCVEWGARGSAYVSGRWKLFCEPYVVTAGNFNGTATFYNFNCLLGGAFVW